MVKLLLENEVDLDIQDVGYVILSMHPIKVLCSDLCNIPSLVGLVKCAGLVGFSQL